MSTELLLPSGLPHVFPSPRCCQEGEVPGPALTTTFLSLLNKGSHWPSW